MAEYVCDFVNQRDGAYPHDELPGPTEIFNERRERVIRCRDCKFYHAHMWYKVTYFEHVCTRWEPDGGNKVDPNGFCSRGIPREDS